MSHELAARLDEMAATREWIAQQRSQEAHVSENEGLGLIAKVELQLSKEHAKVAADLRAAAAAVRAMEWRPIADAPNRTEVKIGKWLNSYTWYSPAATLDKVAAMRHGYTHYFIVPAPPEATR